MAPIIEGPPAEGDPKPPLTKRIGWFALIWVVSLCAVAAVAYALRALIL